MTGTEYGDLWTFTIISRWILLRIKNVSDESCREKNTHIIIIIGIQPLGRSGQRPEFIQAT